MRVSFQRFGGSFTAYPWSREALGLATTVSHRPRTWVTLLAGLDAGGVHRTASASSAPSPERPSAIAADTWFVLAAHVGARLHW